MIHKKFGKPKPIYDAHRKVQKTIGKSQQLREAQKKSTTVKKKPKRSNEECRKLIQDYELGLQEMTAAEYKIKTGISKQKIQRMRAKINRMQQK